MQARRHACGMPKSFLLAAAVIATLTIVPATAAGQARTTSPIARAVSIAERYWGAVPCRGQITILVQQPSPAVLGPDTDAWVMFSSSLGANNLSAPASSYRNCRVALGSYRWPTAASIVQDWDMMCMTMTH